MKLGIDIDGVMADFTLAFTHLAWKMGLTSRAWGPAYQAQWEFNFPTSRVWHEIDNTYNWWMTLEPLVSDNEIEHLNRVIKNHDVYFITAREKTKGFSAEKQSELWLQSIGVDSHHANILTANKGNKGLLCAALGITDMLDDNLDNLRDLQAHGITAWCRKWPYNEGWRLPCGDLNDFLAATGAY